MAPSSIPPHLVQYLVSPQTTEAHAVDALEEWILTRRAKGDTLFEISVGLAELEDRTPPHVCAAFDRARYVTNVPQPSDLTPPMGPFPLARSQSPATILSHLLSQPPPSLEHSREVILEYVLAREGKLREKKYGRGGKGTLGRDGFDDISKRLSEVEDGLRTTATSPRGGQSELGSSLFSGTRRISVGGLDEARQLGLTLILSLRMSLSYFTLRELADQLLSLAVGDAEKTLVQHIRRRVPGEGRWGVGKELEYVEGLVSPRRPALRPAFRSAKKRTYLSAQPNYPVSLPAPSKSACIKLLTTFAHEVDVGGASAISAFVQTFSTSTSPSHFSPGSNDAKSYFLSRRGTTTSPGTPSLMMSVSPKGPISSLSPSPGLPVTPPFNPVHDPNPLASYAMELVTEFLMREKREWMTKSKWAKTGRDQLGKDLGDIESAVCLSNRNTASSNAQTLLPVFLLLRRTLTLPPSPLPPSIVEPYLDILPAPPDPDEVPFREPTVQTTTASLYVNPRLADAAALEVLEELLENERESVEAAGATREQTADWLTDQIESVEKRFPDGSYSEVFTFLRKRIDQPHAPPSDVADEQQPTVSFARQPSLHRRSQSNATASTDEPPERPANGLASLNGPTRLQHTRSISMPTRSSSQVHPDSDDSSEEIVSTRLTPPRPTPPAISQKPELPPLELLTPSHVADRSNRESFLSTSSAGGGWWDVVSAVENESPAPWHQNPRATRRNRASSSSANGILNLPPGAEPAQLLDPATPYHELTGLDLTASPPIPPLRPVVYPSPARSVPIKRPSAPPTPTPATPESHRSLRKNDDQHEVSRPPPLIFNPVRPPFPPERLSDSQPPTAPPSGGTTPPSSQPKSKLGGFGRSVSLASKSMMSRNKDKENEKLAGPGGKDKDKDKDKAGRKGSVQNDPGKWNKDMVANIMGPPAGKR